MKKTDDFTYRLHSTRVLLALCGFLFPFVLNAADSIAEVFPRSSARPVPSSGTSSAFSPPSSGILPAASSTPVPGASPVQSQKKSGTNISLKILTRPSSSILVEASDSAAVVQSNIPGFSVYYLCNQQPGWLQVGKTKSGPSFGWIREKDAILWRQNLVMEFTHPANRMPVMFFKNKDDLKRIVQMNSAARTGAVDSILSQIKSKNIPDLFPVAAMEPNRATDRRTKFYMLPITDFEAIRIDDRDGRLLKVAVGTSNTGDKMENKIFVDWLAYQKDTAAAPPGDGELWVVDRDLKNSAIQPIEVKVMMQKNELAALVKVLDSIIAAGVRGQLTGQNFFEALQSAAALAVSSPDQIRNARNLAATGQLPDFLADLPYKSTLMIMDPATWNSMSVDVQGEFIEQVQAKKKFYEETLKDASLWQALNPDDSEDQKVAPIPLEQLP